MRNRFEFGERFLSASRHSGWSKTQEKGDIELPWRAPREDSHRKNTQLFPSSFIREDPILWAISHD
jgi:hypothetical protein